MRAIVGAAAGLLALAGCGKSAEPVGENSAGSVKTTAIGTIVGTVPTPTPTPSGAAAGNAAAVDDADTAAGDNLAE